MLGKFSAAGHTYGSFLSLLDQSILNLLFKKTLTIYYGYINQKTNESYVSFHHEG